ncbi:MAG: IgGFc-binding protein [Prevotella sp.]|jgi:hypothetical protein|nr:IgGFc-binding protein [Prevotella sp.]
MKQLLLLFFILLSIIVKAQDTEFWFTTNSFGDPRSEGGFFFSNANEKEATVTIKYYKTGQTQTITIPAKSGYAHVLASAFITNNIVAPNDGNVSNCGVYISSTEKVSVYFHWNQYAYQYIAVLKGRVALGTDFYVTQVSDRWITTEGQYDHIVIVASEDNTTFNFTPTRDCYGAGGNYTAGTTYPKTLNKGQTFCVRELTMNSGGAGSFSSLAGTHITSDKPIAVTSAEGVNHDPAVDQIVPVTRLGTDYVIVKGFGLINNGERTYITATENNTKVYATAENGTEALLATLNAGQTTVYNMGNKNAAPYVLSIRSDKPVSVTQYVDCNQSNGNGHTDGAVVPNLTNLSIGDYSFYNIYSATDVYNAILTVYKKGSRGDFSITYNGSTYPISSANAGTVVRYGDVPGRPNLEYMQWELPNAARGKFVNVNNSTSAYTLGYYSASIATFYTTFGYFSTFSSNKQELCYGEKINELISFISLSQSDTYQWQSSFDSVYWTNISGATNSTYQPISQNRGTIYYRVQVTNGTDVVYGQPVEIKVNSCRLPVNHNISSMEYD